MNSLSPDPASAGPLRRRSLAIALFLAAAGLGPIAEAQNLQQPHELIRVPRSIPSHVTPPHGRTIARARLVEIDFGPTGRRRATRDVTTPVHARLRLDLFDGARYHATLRKVSGAGAAGQVFEGEVDGSAGSSVVSLSLPGGGYTAGATLGNTVLAAHFQEIRDRLK